jgi:23S rRNA (uracil1939-C5)-methyltransferase
MEIDLPIDKLAFGGKALGRVDGFVVFVDRALPGQKVRARITRIKKQFAEAQVVQVLEQSPAYVTPFCPHFGLCGGCDWQDLAYEEQLHWKRLHLQDCLKHLAGLSPTVIQPTVPSPQERFYRNKMEFTFAPAEDSACLLGLHTRGSTDRVFDLEHCFLQSRQSPEIVKEVRHWCGRSLRPAYNPQTRRGYWRFLVVREGKRTGQTLVHLLTSDQEDRGAVERLACHLKEQFPEITTLVHSRSRKKAHLAAGGAVRSLWGPGYIEEHIGDLRLRVSAHSFLQTNSLAAEGLYNTIGRLGEFTGSETVWDLYCGAGGIGLFLAPKVGRVVGFELAAAAVADAVTNSRLNNLTNCRFVAGDLKERLPETLKTRSHPLPEVVVADPPRSGLHPRVVEALKELAPRRLIYVSCNPATLARDLGLLKGHYEILAVQPFDLFPQTAHLEGVVSLERRAGGARG